MIRLIIKGNAAQAQEAATKRGIPIQLKEGTSVYEVQAEVDEAHQESVIKWFCEPVVHDKDKGFAPGTLLYHA